MNSSSAENTPPLLDVRGLRKYFPITRGFFRRVVGNVRAVDDVSFVVRQGEALGLVGESGCGKTTVSRSILRAIEPTAGQVLYHTRAGKVVDLASTPGKELKPLRREIQMIFQDPFGSLNPHDIARQCRRTAIGQRHENPPEARGARRRTAAARRAPA